MLAVALGKMGLWEGCESVICHQMPRSLIQTPDADGCFGKLCSKLHVTESTRFSFNSLRRRGAHLWPWVARGRSSHVHTSSLTNRVLSIGRRLVAAVYY